MGRIAVTSLRPRLWALAVDHLRRTQQQFTRNWHRAPGTAASKACEHGGRSIQVAGVSVRVGGRTRFLQDGSPAICANALAMAASKAYRYGGHKVMPAEGLRLGALTVSRVSTCNLPVSAHALVTAA